VIAMTHAVQMPGRAFFLSETSGFLAGEEEWTTVPN
jgi:hypothetical protein